MLPPEYLAYALISVLTGTALLPVFVALGCLAATWRIQPVAQAFVATLGYLALRYGLRMSVSFLTMRGFWGATGVLVFEPVLSGLVIIAVAFVAYRLFVYRIGATWRVRAA